MSQIKLKRGMKSNLPSSLPLGEPAFCVDTQELYVGQGKGKPLIKVNGDELYSLNREVSDLNVMKMDKNDSISVLQIDKNKGKLDQTYFTDEFLRQMSGNAPVHAVPEDKSITREKLAENCVSKEELSDKTLEFNHLDPKLYSPYNDYGYRFSGQVPSNESSSSYTAKWMIFTLSKDDLPTTINANTKVTVRCSVTNLGSEAKSIDRVCIGETDTNNDKHYLEHQIPNYISSSNKKVTINPGETVIYENSVNSLATLQLDYLMVGVGLHYPEIVGGEMYNIQVETIEISIDSYDFVLPEVVYFNFFKPNLYILNPHVDKVPARYGLATYQYVQNYVVEEKNLPTDTIGLEHLRKDLFYSESSMSVTFVPKNPYQWLLFTIQNDLGKLSGQDITLRFRTQSTLGKTIGRGVTQYLDGSDYSSIKIPDFTSSFEPSAMQLTYSHGYYHLTISAKETEKIDLSPNSHLVLGVQLIGFNPGTSNDVLIEDFTAYSTLKNDIPVPYVNVFTYATTSTSNHKLHIPKNTENVIFTKNTFDKLLPSSFIQNHHLTKESVGLDNLLPDVITSTTNDTVKYECTGLASSTQGNVLLRSVLLPDTFVIEPDFSYRLEIHQTIIPRKSGRYALGSGIYTDDYDPTQAIPQWNSGTAYQLTEGEVKQFSYVRNLTLPEEATGIFFGLWSKNDDESDLQGHYEVVDLRVTLNDVELKQLGVVTPYKPSFYVSFSFSSPDDSKSALSIKGVKDYVATQLGNVDLTSNVQGKYISFMGDSISTFKGWIPSGNAVYYNGSNCGVTNVNQTWWKRVVDQTGMNLCVNNSWSGSRVTTTNGEAGAGCMSRATSLHTPNNDPDVIIIYLGINDFNNGVQIGSYDGTQTFPTTTTTFREAYAIMLSKVLTRYKYAKVYVCTLPYCERTGESVFPEKNSNAVLLSQWNNAIRELAHLFGVDIIEFNKCGINYQNLDVTMGDWVASTKKGLHPNPYGMRLLSNEAIKKLNVYAPLSTLD